jgi:hypothetical protein
MILLHHNKRLNKALLALFLAAAVAVLLALIK